jgi:hypothetical protein
MILTITEVANKPNIFTKVIQLNNYEKVIFRPVLFTKHLKSLMLKQWV